MFIRKTILIQKSSEEIFSLINDFKQWSKWSPWLISDPKTELSFENNKKYYTWKSEIIGSGNMQILSEEYFFLSNFVNINVLDEIKRIPGVGKAQNMGEKKYAIRIWLDPNKLKALSITPIDVINAVKSQNKQASIGKIGGTPTYDNQKQEFTNMTQYRFRY